MKGFESEGAFMFVARNKIGKLTKSVNALAIVKKGETVTDDEPKTMVTLLAKISEESQVRNSAC